MYVGEFVEQVRGSFLALPKDKQQGVERELISLFSNLNEHPNLLMFSPITQQIAWLLSPYAVQVNRIVGFAALDVVKLLSTQPQRARDLLFDVSEIVLGFKVPAAVAQSTFEGLLDELRAHQPTEEEHRRTREAISCFERQQEITSSLKGLDLKAPASLAKLAVLNRELPYDGRVYVRQILAATAQERSDTAKSACEKLLQIQPFHVLANTILAKFAIEANDLEAVERYTDAGLIGDPKNAVLLLIVAANHQKQEMGSLATAYAHTALISGLPTVAEQQVAVSLVAGFNKEDEQALQDLGATIDHIAYQFNQLYPSDLSARLWLGAPNITPHIAEHAFSQAAIYFADAQNVEMVQRIIATRKKMSDSVEPLYQVIERTQPFLKNPQTVFTLLANNE